MSRKFLILVLLIILSAGIGFSQQNTNSSSPKKSFKLKDKLAFGGNFGVSFGTQTFINISPELGYRITPKFTAGLGIVYNYYADRRYNFNTNIFGGKVFTTFLVYQNAFVHFEYEALSLETKYFDYAFQHQGEDRFWIGSPLIGAGYRFPLGGNAGVNVMILYNLNETMNYPYSNPVFRVGFNL